MIPGLFRLVRAPAPAHGDNGARGLSVSGFVAGVGCLVPAMVMMMII